MAGFEVSTEVNALLKKVDVDGRTYVVIEVPPFADTPHICQKDYPEVLAAHALYVRTANNETAPIRSSADFRAIVDQALRNRADSLIATVSAIIKGAPLAVENDAARFGKQYDQALAAFAAANELDPKTYPGWREYSCWSSSFDPTALSMDQVRAAAARADVNFLGWPFLYVGKETHAIQDGLQTYVASHDFGGHRRADFWRLQQSGFFFERRLLREEGYRLENGGMMALVDRMFARRL